MQHYKLKDASDEPSHSIQNLTTRGIWSNTISEYATLVPSFTAKRMSYFYMHDSGLYIQKILTNREMVNFQKLDFLRFLTTNSFITGAHELNETQRDIARYP